MPSYTYTSEQGKQVTIKSEEHARRVISATAMILCYTEREIAQDKQLMDILVKFDIPLLSIVVIDNPDPNDFPYFYLFFSTVEKAHAYRKRYNNNKVMSLFKQGRHKEVCDFVDSLYGWKLGELIRSSYTKEDARRCLVFL